MQVKYPFLNNNSMTISMWYKQDFTQEACFLVQPAAQLDGDPYLSLLESILLKNSRPSVPHNKYYKPSATTPVTTGKDFF